MPIPPGLSPGAASRSSFLPTAVSSALTGQEPGGGYFSGLPIAGDLIATTLGSTAFNPAWNYLGAGGAPMTAAEASNAATAAKNMSWSQALKADVPHAYQRGFVPQAGQAKLPFWKMPLTGGTPATRKLFETATGFLPKTVAKFAGPVGSALGVSDLAYRGMDALLEATDTKEFYEDLGGAMAGTVDTSVPSEYADIARNFTETQAALPILPPGSNVGDEIDTSPDYVQAGVGMGGVGSAIKQAIEPSLGSEWTLGDPNLPAALLAHKAGEKLGLDYFENRGMPDDPYMNEAIARDIGKELQLGGPSSEIGGLWALDPLSVDDYDVLTHVAMGSSGYIPYGLFSDLYGATDVDKYGERVQDLVSDAVTQEYKDRGITDRGTVFADSRLIRNKAQISTQMEDWKALEKSLERDIPAGLLIPGAPTFDPGRTLTPYEQFVRQNVQPSDPSKWRDDVIQNISDRKAAETFEDISRTWAYGPRTGILPPPPSVTGAGEFSPSFTVQPTYAPSLPSSLPSVSRSYVPPPDAAAIGTRPDIQYLMEQYPNAAFPDVEHPQEGQWVPRHPFVVPDRKYDPPPDAAASQVAPPPVPVSQTRSALDDKERYMAIQDDLAVDDTAMASLQTREELQAIKEALANAPSLNVDPDSIPDSIFVPEGISTQSGIGGEFVEPVVEPTPAEDKEQYMATQDALKAEQDRIREENRVAADEAAAKQEQVRADNQRRAEESARAAETARQHREAQERQAEEAARIAEKSQAADDRKAAARAQERANAAAERERQAAIERKEADARQRATEKAAADQRAADDRKQAARAQAVAASQAAAAAAERRRQEQLNAQRLLTRFTAPSRTWTQPSIGRGR